MRMGAAWFFYSGLVDKFVFDSLQIPGGCSHICRRCSSPTCTSLAARQTGASIGQVVS